MIQGSATLSKSFERTMRDLEKAPEQIEKQLELEAFRIRTIAQQEISKISQGKAATRYDLPRGKRPVTVSKPGDAPNTDTGTAIRSIKVYLENGRIFVGTKLPYLAYLEFHSKKTKRRARPWLGPAFKAWFKRHGTKRFKLNLPKKGGK